jgi:hypothetical protein
MGNARGKRSVVVYLPHELVQAVDRVAKFRNESRSRYVEAALRGSLSDDAMFAKVLNEPQLRRAFADVFTGQTLRLLVQSLGIEAPDDKQLQLLEEVFQHAGATEKAK